MSQIQVRFLADRLEEAYRKSSWHSLKGVLKGLTSEEASWRPFHYKGFAWNSGSILDILFHVGADKHVQMDWAFGSRTLTWKGMTTRFQQEGGDLKPLCNGWKAV